MKPSDLAIALRRCTIMQRPAMIWGPPGVGKSDLVGLVAQRRADELTQQKVLKDPSEFGLIDFRLAMRDPTDIKGFPMPDQATRTMKFFRDGELPNSGSGILFGDEINSAAPATQSAFMQLTLTRKIGDYELPPGWTILAAGNRESDRGVVHRMPTPLANRFTHYDYEIDPRDWMDWALDNGVSGALVAFIRFKQELLFKFDPKVDSRAFPTPRSWVATEGFVTSDDPDAVKAASIQGTVGDGPGSEYWGFLQMIGRLPTIEEIRLEPTKARLPEPGEASARLAVSTLCGAHAGPDSYDAFLTYMSRLDVELQCVFNRDAIRRNRELAKNSAYVKWTLKHSDVIVG